MSIRLQSKKQEVRRLRRGYPLMKKEFLQDQDIVLPEGALFELYQGDHFIARGYLGEQNRGIGWILTRDQREDIDAEFFRKKLTSAIGRRDEFSSLPDTDCYRLFNAEGDGIGGLTIDCLGGYHVFHWYSRGIYGFRETILSQFRQLVDSRGIYEKRRFKDEGAYLPGDDFVMGQRHPEDFFIMENGLRYRANLNDGAMFGLFLDQREVRKAIKERYGANRRVLNAFSYTGAFSVAAKAGGAKQTVSVDLAKRSRPMTEDNFRLNGMDPGAERIVVEDIYQYFRFARKRKQLFDLIVLDPPSFSRSKKRVFRAEKDYQELVEQALGLAAKGAILILSTNCSSLPVERFRQFAVSAAKATKRTLRILEEYRNPKDFPAVEGYPESNYLKVLIVEVD